MEEPSFTKCLNDRVTEQTEEAAAQPAKSDEDVVRRVVNGEKDQFSLLYERYYWRAFRMAYGMTRDRAGAEDLTQEIFIRAYQRLRDFREESAFSTWFYRLAVNRSLNYRRKQQPGPTEETTIELEQEQSGRSSSELEAEVLQGQLHSQVHSALLTLKPKLRMVVVLKDIEGLSYEEIARRMNCSMGTVASRLNRSRSLLARKLEHLRGAY